MTQNILFPYPKTLKKQLWESYLQRFLEQDEAFIIDDLRNEKYFNKKLEDLHIIAAKKGLYVPMLTNLHGNCLFESLEHYGICSSKNDMRQGLAYLLSIFKNHKGLFKDPRSPKEIFADINEIENVLCKDVNRAYKYTYDIMCEDLASNFSWTRLPTQLILMFMSKLFNISIDIISNTTDYVHEINENDDSDKPFKVVLGHIGETHYVPIFQRIGGPDEDRLLFHYECRQRFLEWAHAMEQSINERAELLGTNVDLINKRFMSYDDDKPPAYTEGSSTDENVKQSNNKDFHFRDNSNIEKPEVINFVDVNTVDKIVDSEIYVNYD
jgi:hypothetical protein